MPNVIDFSSVKERPLLPKGWLSKTLPEARAEIVHAEETVSKVRPDGGGGNRMINLRWKITLPEGHPQYAQFNNQVVFDRIMLEGDGLIMTLLALEALGLAEREELDETDPETGKPKFVVHQKEWDTEDLVGLEADLNITHREYEGRVNQNRGGIRPIQVGMESALDLD